MNLDDLNNGRFEIRPLAYRMGRLFKSELYGSWLRWSNDWSRHTAFTFRPITEGDKRYFHIFSADFPDCYVTMGLFSWYVRCTHGDPTGDIDGTWEIQRLEYNNGYCNTLCTKDGNYMRADGTRRIHGQRGGISEKSMFFINKLN